MKLYIIRHGQTDWNKVKRLQGRSDIPLNEYGRRLAEETAEGMKDIPFDAAFTSPLVRAKETAQIIMGDRNAPIIEDERIIEIGFGEYEGLSCSKEHFEIPDKTFLNFFEKPEAYTPAEHGESFAEVKKREGDFLKELFEDERYQESTLLISTHGAALCGMLSVIKDTPIEEYWGDGLHKNCGFSIVEVENGQGKVIAERMVLYNE